MPARRKLTDEEIVARIMTAIVEQRLPPGTKLGEDRLAEAFGVSRTRVRQVLLRLAGDRVVTQIANRGAFVAQPGVQEARDVFDARRAIESILVARLAERAIARDVARLREHLERERTARAAGDKPAEIKLSGEFHLLVAAMAGNAVLADTLRELVARSSLIIAVYGSPAGSDCATDEHRDLVDAVRRRDADRAAELMRVHLAHVEATLDLRDRSTEAVDLGAVLAG